jgi:hypothetical protein
MIFLKIVILDENGSQTKEINELITIDAGRPE